MNNNNNVYIMSLEGADIYNHMFRGREIKKEYIGMLAYSLELIKLRAEGLLVKTIKRTNNVKEQSDDIINIKFKYKVQNGASVIIKKEATLVKLNEKLLTLDLTIAKDLEKHDKTILAIAGVKKSIIDIKNEMDTEKWAEVKNDILRTKLYEEGFTITTVDAKTSKVTEDKYVVYKRSGSKSRTGQCLFIKEHLLKPMITWSRMGLDFISNDWDSDYAGLLAYESLVGSHLEDTMKISVDNILIVEDVNSKFYKKCNVVKTDDTTGLLGSFEDDYEISNCLFDGECLLEGKYFKDGESMNLLRQHMFKSASFSTNISSFLIKNCPVGQNFFTWEIENMFGEKILAKDVHMICTPTSVKALKFAKGLGMTKQEMWNYWKDIVRAEGSIFGICKHEKPSLRGVNDNGTLVQQTSYQMLNSTGMSFDDMDNLATFEKEYVMKLRNDDEAFIKYARKNASDLNSFLMMAELAEHNTDFISSLVFRDFRKHKIGRYVKHAKRGKIRLDGDYCILIGNGLELLYHAIGQLDVENPQSVSLKDNEIYTKLNEDGLDLVCFRNPHTSPSNILIGKNTWNTEIDKYFNFSKNIVYVNAIGFPIMDILSGSDYDSDNMVIFNNDKMLEVAKNCSGFNVCINKVKSESKKYIVNAKNMAVIDNQLSTSQSNIGTVVNMGQLLMSTYWNMPKEDINKEKLAELMKKVDIATILSGICIDLAKKFYSIDLIKEINNLSKSKLGKSLLEKEKPTFFVSISQSKTMKNRVKNYDCPMDYLQTILKDIDKADYKTDFKFEDLLVKQDIVKANKRQKREILEYVDEMCTKIASIKSKEAETKSDIKERDERLDSIIKYYNFYMSKKTVKADTMYTMLRQIDKSKNKTKLLNVLYITQKETFLNAFKNKSVHQNEKISA
ncbi:hypothetical protein [Clostridium tagluense]|uniref:Uncharacterized protein n=1 Tax=Clostridium tagluense TaxID=360422 RepID=A0A401UPF4_9CLOT|nr:hypothetical protein [Clostridium tagluense]GCD11406.1 hypothetical protein Ctaglu_30290 [Clostridium tagluense]